ncbi:alpha-1,2-fucosyltransferase [Nonomuraea sp. NPDC049400]|uniref:alpha-1,2-fucosyltransferase n=1 Tax=Nonomuraea sp. NPDC049400 TaxID=3364352 RepID=UPI0037BA059A
MTEDVRLDRRDEAATSDDVALTFSQLGLYGRLGNNLWQIAAVIGRAIDLNLPIRLPPWSYSAAFNIPREWFRPLKPTDVDVFATVDYLKPRDERWLQDTRLWWNHREAVRTCLSPTDDVLSECYRVYPRLLENGPVTAIHVRRGDYLRFQRYYLLPSADYYRRALGDTDPEDVIVLTDDPDWVLTEMRFLRGAQLSVDQPNIVDLACMTRCHRHVIANSSFSWWGAFLSGSDEVKYPRDWYTPEYAHLRSEYLTPSSWQPDC